MVRGGDVEISGDDVALFASDMHLGDHDRQTAAFFLGELAAAWPAASDVFLLGDLFEAWVGDDQPDAVAREAQDLFRRMTAGGCRLFAMRGNRDFLLDMPKGDFSARTGAVMLDDPCRVELFGEPVVLAHADALCSDDVAYQRVREQVRGETWQAQFLARPLAERLAIARAHFVRRARAPGQGATRRAPPFRRAAG
ncbi:MAG: UDP-2,3-diacylglucosamine diphosphatase [Gammaproteobacteria bacterium]